MSEQQSSDQSDADQAPEDLPVPEDLEPSEDNPLAEGLEPGETEGDLLHDGKAPESEDDR